MLQAEDHLGEEGERPLDALVRHANGSLAGQSNGSVVDAANVLVATNSPECRAVPQSETDKAFCGNAVSRPLRPCDC
ncbi:hypothetical protein SBA3_2580006 [Candidatus Sulfopaludibacter sp. SbA3]|nr:hypothetical protein SBA3_2580006 [Candidatus Sulfopaludibacter sp. SbA3]